jgi:beta-phosphoglucomutase
MPMLAAVIFDFDGVIVDSEPLHHQAFADALAGDGIRHTWEEYVQGFIGFDDRDALREMFKRAGRPLNEDRLQELVAAKGIAFQHVLDRRGVKPYPGAVELIRRLNGEVPLALCSGALRQDIVPILDKLQLTLAFNVAVTADDVPASKPDPASYRLAVERLAATFPDRRITADRCLAIEDTPAGIQAARGAGVRVLAVSNSHPPEQLTGAVRVVESLKDLSRERLNHLL